MRNFMAKKLEELSVFFPAYNEEGNIEKTVLDARRILQKVARKWEIIIINDGSRDKTGKISDKLSKDYKNIRVVHHSPNRGYGGALKSGFSAANYEWVAFADSDGQFKFSDIEKFIKLKDNADLILGIRAERADSIVRKFYTFVWSKFLPRLLFNLKVTDYSCGFKMIKSKVYDRVQPLIGEEKVTQIEMLVKAQRAGFRFAEVEVGHFPRTHGTQTGANIKVVAKSIRDLLKLWWKLKKF